MNKCYERVYENWSNENWSNEKWSKRIAREENCSTRKLLEESCSKKVARSLRVGKIFIMKKRLTMRNNTYMIIKVISCEPARVIAPVALGEVA